MRITVADTGVGMDAATLRRATEPFFTTKRVGVGTGLGLSMAKGFAEQSGGGLAIESSPGQGTTVSLWLPGDGRRRRLRDAARTRWRGKPARGRRGNRRGRWCWWSTTRT